jgi:hypothetical protein
MNMSLKRRYHLFTILSVLVVTAGGILTWRASAVTVVPAGYDQFNTIGGGATNETWSGGLPSGFFKNKEGYNSNAIGGPLNMTFTGRNSVPGFSGDTVIERTSAVTVPGSSPLVLTGIQFIAEGQITAAFPAGTPSVTYSVLVQQSVIAPSTGTITFNLDGSYGSSLTVNRQYTFAPTDTSQPNTVADSTTARDGSGTLLFPENEFSGTGTWSLPGGASAGPAIQAESVGPAAAATTSPNRCLINPNSEAGSLAAHGILPAGCPSPSPSPTSSPVPSPTVKPTVVPGA